MQILLLPRYGPQGASSRLRSFQFLPALRDSGMDIIVSPLFRNELLMRKYRRGRYGFADLASVYAQRIRSLLTRHRFDLIWIEKEALPWLPAWLERHLLRKVPYVLDFDDAVFHNYDRHPSALVRNILGKRIDHIMAGSRLVLAGNSYLAARANGAGAAHVQVVPTVVDLERYSPKLWSPESALPRIVWIGSPSTTRYLSMLAEPLAHIARTRAFTLRVIGGSNVQMPGVRVEMVEWSESTESQAISECDIGVMPLADTQWERGKCAYKLIQYMACGLPTVASPVGANSDVTIDGQTGYLARTDTEWIMQLEALLGDPALRWRMGNAGRARVEQCYSLQQAAPRVVALLQQAGGVS